MTLGMSRRVVIPRVIKSDPSHSPTRPPTGSYAGVAGWGSGAAQESFSMTIGISALGRVFTCPDFVEELEIKHV